MISKSLKEIQDLCGGWGLKEEFYDLRIQGVSTDSRKIGRDQLFIPLVGDRFDGHEFLHDLEEQGVRASLSSDPNIDLSIATIYVEDSLEALQKLAQAYIEEIGPKVVAITGSNGKTSTKDILASLLKRDYKTHKTQGNFNNLIGLPLTILDMDEDVEVAVLEMGIDKFGEMDRLSSIARPDLGVITNAGEAHLDDLGNSRNVAKAKMEFIDHLKGARTYLYFKDDENLDSLAQELDPSLRTISYGLARESDFPLEIVRLDSQGSYFRMPGLDEEEFFLPLIGKHQVYNAGAAIALALELGVSLEHIRLGLEEVQGTGMRNELKEGDGFTILDDSYKSNPSSLMASLETLYSLEGYGQKIVVLGDMLGIGDDVEEMHREIGRKIDEREIDYIIGIGYYAEYIIWEAEERFGQDRLLHFEEKPDNIADIIKSLLGDQAIIMVKASRPLELDTIVRDLLK